MDQKKNVTRVSTGTIWEEIVGYSRALKIENQVEITGTLALDEEGNLVGVGSAADQTRRIIQIAEKVLTDFGGSLEDVIRSRIFVTNIDEWEEIGRVHGEYFSKIRPATTMVEISRLVLPEAKVEIEFSAILD